MPGLGDFRVDPVENAKLQTKIKAKNGGSIPTTSTNGQTPVASSQPIPEQSTNQIIQQPPIRFNRSSSQQKRSEPLRYPNQEIHNTTDYLQIAIVGYKSVAENNPRLNNNRRLVGKPGSRRNSAKERFATIFLPIPSNVQDGNTVSYSDSSLNGLTEMIAGLSLDTMINIGKAVGQGNIQEAQTAAVNAFKAAGAKIDGATAVDLITKKLTSSAVGLFGGNVSVNDLLNREQGIIFNPNMELLFNGPTLRSFKFSFKMTPRNQPEAEAVANIINTLKRNMAPQVATTGNSENLFLKTPNIFELTYKKGDEPHPFLHRFKQCFLEDITVNYTGEGTYATYCDGVPISLVMDLQFKELEPIYDIDYDAPDEDGKQMRGVGY